MGATGALTLLGISLLCYVIGLAGIIAGILGNAWFVTKEDIGRAIPKEETGLINTCTSTLTDTGTTCTKRKTLFKFEDNIGLGEEMDIVLSMLIASAIICFLAFTVALAMICYRKKKASWRCSAITSFIFGLLAAILGLAALGYSESKFSDIWSAKSHGWSNIICWVGCAGQILASVLVVILVWISPVSSGREKNTGVHYVGNMNPTYQHDYQTRY